MWAVTKQIIDGHQYNSLPTVLEASNQRVGHGASAVTVTHSPIPKAALTG